MGVLWFAREGIDSTIGFAAYDLPLKTIVTTTWEANVISSSTRGSTDRR
jgi:hypothetical protein